MTFSQRIVLLGGLLALAAALGLVPGPAQSQTLNHTLTDPNAIAQECGGDAQTGAPLFAQSCASCHSLTEQDATPMAPHLAGIYGRSAGGQDGYPYSPQIKALDLSWEGESLHRLLSGEIAVPGHPVIEADQMRRDLLTYLRTQSRPAPPAPQDVVVPAAVLALEGDAEWGEYLAGDCVSCHSAASEAAGVPPIHGWDSDRFVLKMHQYRARAIGEDAMQMQAMRLSDDEIAALAAYFTSISPNG